VYNEWLIWATHCHALMMCHCAITGSSKRYNGTRSRAHPDITAVMSGWASGWGEVKIRFLSHNIHSNPIRSNYNRMMLTCRTTHFVLRALNSV
jgi:hypothetical protein